LQAGNVLPLGIEGTAGDPGLHPRGIHEIRASVTDSVEVSGDLGIFLVATLLKHELNAGRWKPIIHAKNEPFHDERQGDVIRIVRELPVPLDVLLLFNGGGDHGEVGTGNEGIEVVVESLFHRKIEENLERSLTLADFPRV